MTMTDPLGDMLTRIRNAHARKRAQLRSPWSRLRCAVLDVLRSEGYIEGYEVVAAKTPGGADCQEIVIALKYLDNEPVIRSIARVSRPGRRVYSSLRKLPMVHNGLGVYILSTPQGVMSDAKARAAKLGGEILCQVF